MLSKPPKAVWDHLTLVMQVGLTVVGSVLFCLWLGYKIDQWLGIKGVFTIVFILLGIAGGGYTAYRQIADLGIDGQQDNDGDSSDQRGGSD